MLSCNSSCYLLPSSWFFTIRCAKASSSESGVGVLEICNFVALICRQSVDTVCRLVVFWICCGAQSGQFSVMSDFSYSNQWPLFQVRTPCFVSSPVQNDHGLFNVHFPPRLSVLPSNFLPVAVFMWKNTKWNDEKVLHWTMIVILTDVLLIQVDDGFMQDPGFSFEGLISIYIFSTCNQNLGWGSVRSDFKFAAVTEGVEWSSSNLKVGSSIPSLPKKSACRSVLEQDAEPRIVPHRTTKCC